MADPITGAAAARTEAAGDAEKALRRALKAKAMASWVFHRGSSTEDYATLVRAEVEACEAAFLAVRALAERVAALEQERDEARRKLERATEPLSHVYAADERQLREFAKTEVTGFASTTPTLVLNPYSASALVRVLDHYIAQVRAARAAAERSEGDAERWRKLMGCERVRVLGHARLGTPDAHIGLELWGEHPACEAFPDEWYHRQMQARGEFTAFVDGLRATPAPAAPRAATEPETAANLAEELRRVRLQRDQALGALLLVKAEAQRGVPAGTEHGTLLWRESLEKIDRIATAGAAHA